MLHSLRYILIIQNRVQNSEIIGVHSFPIFIYMENCGEPVPKKMLCDSFATF